MSFKIVDLSYQGNPFGTKRKVSKIIRESGYKPEFSGKDNTMYIVYNRTLIKARQKQGNYYNDDPVCKIDYHELVGYLINKYTIRFNLIYCVK